MFEERGPAQSKSESGRQAQPGVQELSESQRLLRCAVEAFSHHQSGKGLRFVEQAVSAVDHAAGTSLEARVGIRTEVVHTLTMYNEPQEAERYLRDACVLLATSSEKSDREVQHLRVWRAEVILRSGNLGEALDLARSVFDWSRSNAPNSLLEVRALLVEAFIAAQRGTTQEYGAVMAQAFGTIAVLKIDEMFALSQTLASFSAAEEAQGRFINAKFLADAAISAYEQSSEESVEAARMLRAHQAEMYLKTGDFTGAKRLLTVLLKELIAAEGQEDPFALQVRISLAESCVEIGEFETGESHLRSVLDIAESHDVFPMAWRAADVLAMLYIARGMDEEAKEIQVIIEALQRDLSQANKLVNKADGPVSDLALHGDPESALQDLDELFKEVDQVEESERPYVEASLLATRAWILSSHDPGEGREVLQQVFDRLTELPPELEESLRIKIAMTEAQLAIAEEKPEVACAVVQEQLDGLTKRQGRASFNARGALLHRLATWQHEAGWGDKATSTARELVNLFTERGETNSVRFAQSLILLARLLPDEAEERDELVEQALQVMQRRGLRLDDA